MCEKFIKRVIVESSNGVTILNTPLTNTTTVQEIRDKFASSKTPVIQSVEIDIQGTALVKLVTPLYRT